MATADRRGAPRHQAIIELDEDYRGLESLLEEMDPGISAETMSESPRGYVWYALSSSADDLIECERAITALLQRLRYAASRGRLPSFRIIVGHRDAAAHRKAPMGPDHSGSGH